MGKNNRNEKTPEQLEAEMFEEYTLIGDVESLQRLVKTHAWIVEHDSGRGPEHTALLQAMLRGAQRAFELVKKRQAQNTEGTLS